MRETLYQGDNYLVEKKDSGEVWAWGVYYNKELGIVDLSNSTFLYSSYSNIPPSDVDDLPKQVQDIIIKEVI